MKLTKSEMANKKSEGMTKKDYNKKKLPTKKQNDSCKKQTRMSPQYSKEVAVLYLIFLCVMSDCTCIKPYMDKSRQFCCEIFF